MVDSVAVTTPRETSSNVDFPSGPTFTELLDSEGDIAWVRYKVWSADWYTEALSNLVAVLGAYDRYVGVEMAIDGALGALSGAFDASVASLIRSAERFLNTPEAKRTPAHLYKWATFKKLANGTAVTSYQGVPELISEVDQALAGEKSESPTGWLAVLRRLRNRTTHQTTLPRTWGVADDGASVVIGVSGLPALDPLEYLKESCDRVSDITERVLRIANSLAPTSAYTPLARTAWRIRPVTR